MLPDVVLSHSLPWSRGILAVVLDAHFLRTSGARIPRALLLTTLFAGAGLAAEPVSLQSVEDTAGEWVKIRSETVRLESDWRSERALLESTVQGLQERATTLEEKRDYARAKTAKDRDELATLREKNDATVAELQKIETRLKALGEQILRLRPALPPRLSDALEMAYRNLSEPDTTPGERMQAVTTILNRCTQFNRLVSCDEEVLSIEGESAARSLEVIYWGLSHGYALDRANGKAWLGYPGPQGWRWELRPDAVRPATRLIAIYRDQADPEFVTIPARLSHATAETPNR